MKSRIGLSQNIEDGDVVVISHPGKCYEYLRNMVGEVRKSKFYYYHCVRCGSRNSFVDVCGCHVCKCMIRKATEREQFLYIIGGSCALLKRKQSVRREAMRQAHIIGMAKKYNKRKKRRGKKCLENL